MPRVNIQGIGVVNFPDDMSGEQIDRVIREQILDNQKPKEELETPSLSAAFPRTPQPDLVQRAPATLSLLEQTQREQIAIAQQASDDDINQPLLQVTPEQIAMAVPGLALLPKEVATGLAQGSAELISGMTSPRALAEQGWLGAVTAIAPPLGTGIVAGLGAKGLGETAGTAVEALRQGDVQTAAAQVPGALLSSAMMLPAPALGLARAKPPAPPRIEAIHLEKSAEALDQLARQIESAEVLRAEAKATEATLPSRDPLSTPEALRRTEELQLTETPAVSRPAEMVGPETLGPLVDPGYRREIVLRADAAAERIKLALQRRAEFETAKLAEGEAFPKGAQTKAARSAEERIVAERSFARESDVYRDPVITDKTPLKDVEQIVRERLEQRDWEGAVTALSQTKAEVPRKLLDKLLGVEKEAVPLSVAERTIFNEIWERTLEKLDVKPAPSLVQRLESLKSPLEGGVGANPFPQIAKAVWNTGIDIAIGVVKAGGKFADAIEAALSHIRKNAQGFDEASVRQHFEKLLRAEMDSAQGRTAAAKVSDSPLEVAVEQKAARSEPLPQASTRPLGDIYTEPIVERLGRIGGPVSRKVAQENFGILDRSKRLWGELRATAIDHALRTSGKAFRGGTTWIHSLRKVTPHAAVSRFVDVIETRARTGNWNHVPEQFRELASTLFDANFTVGRLGERASPGFQARGFIQRLLTPYGYDLVKRGASRAWDQWTEALALANNRPVESVRAFFRDWKKELDKPSADATHLDRIAQDFQRNFPNAITHLRPQRGLGWHEVLVSSPFDYLLQAGQRTANAAAFREVYPLIQHEGQWVPSGKLEATRAAVMKELRTDKHAAEFDTAMRALQGHPVDALMPWWKAPDTFVGASARAAQTVLRPFRALMLSAALPVNLWETASGGAQIFAGYGKAFKAMATQAARYKQLKRSGMLNAAIRDFSFDPTQPGRSASRIVSNALTRLTLSDFLNEVQEFSGAAAARIIADEIRSGTLPKQEQTRVKNIMRAMGIDRASVEAAVLGNNPRAVEVFETAAAARLSGGNQAWADRSILGATPAFNELFWFHNYPMMKLNQGRAILNNLIDDAARRDVKSARDNAMLLGKYLGGSVLAGAFTIGTLRWLYEGGAGIETLTHEATDDPFSFLFDVTAQAFGGPIAIAGRALDLAGDLDSAATLLLGAMAPYGVARDLSAAVLGQGPYEGTPEIERAGLFLKSKAPISKAIKQGMAAWGLSQDDVELDSAIKAFYRWRRDIYGSKETKAFLEDPEDRKRFRYHMKRAVEALKDGKLEDYELEAESALASPAMEAKPLKESRRSVASSLRGRRLLKTPEGGPLDEEALSALESRIGSKALEKLQLFDLMLEHEARRF